MSETVYIYETDVIVHADNRTEADAVYEKHTCEDLSDYCDCCGPDVVVAEVTIEEWASECQEDWHKRNAAKKQIEQIKPLLQLVRDELRPLQAKECELRDKMRPLAAKIDDLARRVSAATYTLNTTPNHEQDTHLPEETK